MTIAVRNPRTGEVDYAIEAVSPDEIGAIATRLRKAQPEWLALGAEGRVAAFLLSLSARLGALGSPWGGGAVLTPVGGGRVPVAGAGKVGRGRVSATGPSAGPIWAPLASTRCSTMAPSTVCPTRTARGGCPSTDNRATPLKPLASPDAKAPRNWMRPAKADWAPGSIAWDAATAGPLNRRRKSPFDPLSIDTEVALDGTGIGCASQRRPQ